MDFLLRCPASFYNQPLKKIGDLFNKKFSRETHNMLKHLLKKIGLTSTKNLGAAISGILEIAVLTCDYASWKIILASKVKKGLKTWEKETLSLVQEDIDKLETENIENISMIAKCYTDAFAVDETPAGDIKSLQAQLTVSKVEVIIQTFRLESPGHLCYTVIKVM